MKYILIMCVFDDKAVDSLVLLCIIAQMKNVLQ